MEKFTPGEYYHARKEKPFDIIQPTSLGYQLVVQYLEKKYETKIIREDKIDLNASDLDKNIHLLNDKIAEARKKTTEDYRFAWVSGTNHADLYVYIKEKGEEALFSSDTNGKNSNFTQKLSELTKLPVYATADKRQADNRSCFTDSIVFSRDITGLDKKTGNYLIPNFLSLLKSRATKRSANSYEVKLPDELLKTTQLSEFVMKHKEPADRLVHENETLQQFRTRYRRKGIVKDQEKWVATYLVDKGYKYKDIMQIQFYLNQMPYLSDDQRKAFVKDAKKRLKSVNDSSANDSIDLLYQFVIQRATDLGHPPEVVLYEELFFSTALSKCRKSTVFNEMALNESFDKLKIFYGLIPPQYYLRVLTHPVDDNKNTVLHLTTMNHPEVYKYLINSLEAEQCLPAVTVQGQNNNTVLHWLASKPKLFTFTLQKILKHHRLQALTAYGQDGNTVLHWLDNEEPETLESLQKALLLLPKNQRLQALTVEGRGGLTPLSRMRAKPECIKIVLSSLFGNERKALEMALALDNKPPLSRKLLANLIAGLEHLKSSEELDVLEPPEHVDIPESSEKTDIPESPEEVVLTLIQYTKKYQNHLVQTENATRKRIIPVVESLMGILENDRFSAQEKVNHYYTFLEQNINPVRDDKSDSAKNFFMAVGIVFLIIITGILPGGIFLAASPEIRKQVFDLFTWSEKDEGLETLRKTGHGAVRDVFFKSELEPDVSSHKSTDDLKMQL